MDVHLEVNDPRYAQAAAAILRRHDNFEAEANITTAVRDFLILTGLANADEIIEENPPSDDSRRAVDLTALDTFVEFKRRIGTAGGFNPDPANVAQLDEYLELSKSTGKGVRTGILTDGRYWLLRWPGAGLVRTERPYGFVLDSPERWLPLFEWLRDSALLSLESIPADRDNIKVPRAGQPHLPAGHRHAGRVVPGCRRLRNHPGETAVVGGPVAGRPGRSGRYFG